MGWLAKAIGFLSQAKKAVDIINGLFALIKGVWVNWQAKRAQGTVDETVKTGDQRAEEAAIGSGSGVPHVDPDGGLQERPVKDRS